MKNGTDSVSKESVPKLLSEMFRKLQYPFVLVSGLSLDGEDVFLYNKYDRKFRNGVSV